MATSEATAAGSPHAPARRRAARPARSGETGRWPAAGQGAEGSSKGGDHAVAGGHPPTAARGRGVHPAARSRGLLPAARARDLRPGRDARALARAAGPPATADGAAAPVRTLAREGDLVVTLGANGSAVAPRGAGRAAHVVARTVTARAVTARVMAAVRTTAGHGFRAAPAHAPPGGLYPVGAVPGAGAVASVPPPHGTAHGATDSRSVRADVPGSPSGTQRERAATR